MTNVKCHTQQSTESRRSTRAGLAARPQRAARVRGHRRGHRSPRQGLAGPARHLHRCRLHRRTAISRLVRPTAASSAICRSEAVSSPAAGRKPTRPNSVRARLPTAGRRPPRTSRPPASSAALTCWNADRRHRRAGALMSSFRRPPGLSFVWLSLAFLLSRATAGPAVGDPRGSASAACGGGGWLPLSAIFSCQLGEHLADGVVEGVQRADHLLLGEGECPS